MPAAPEPKLDALIQDCSLQSAQACFRKLCPGGFKRQSEELDNPDAERFTSFTQFGELPLDGDTLFFAYAESENDLTERSARKAQFDAARDLLKARGEYDAGIFIFRGRNGAFRLSYITKIYKGSKADFSHFRRYTYFVDPATDGNGTFIRQIGSCSFDSLDAIQEAFSVEAINKDFYKELANWYFWAMKHVHFPTDDVALDKKDLLADKQKVREHDAKNLIRLLTRMLFVWFIKQRKLVPHELFDAEAVARDYLDGFDATSSDSRYYKAILQNFFFAALNQERGKREFRKMGAAHRDNMCLMRYKDAFKNPQRFLDTVEATTPFLNGGLFECLDFLHPTEKGPQGGAKKCYEDGFSDHKDNPLVVPDFLFFAPEHKSDLSDTWGIASKKNEPVQGLIHILNRYNFTIVENSPIEQEVALDPELLGKVFENLLASYNPETQTTARKQTGSFYTPRPIVDYMVDESLKAYLLKPLTEAASMGEEDAKVGLDLLFSYEEKEMETVFNEAEINVLIRAIDQCKILDPACGSGAFPMGILQKLVFVLGKLDKKNRRWKERQLSKVDRVIQTAELIEDSEFSGRIIADAEKQKRDIENSFENNDLGFGRKLYLIENCLYGVDIQSIATQVSKLRFFISLVVDQNIDREHPDGNFDVRPLPNLETKFVAADTLIAIDKPSAQAELAELTDVKKLQNELQDIRHKIFSVKTTTSKQKYKDADKAKRQEIAAALKANGWPDDTADRLAKWDPYKQNDSADFFDPEWMFGLKGFDVVIGNPPYVLLQAISDDETLENYFKENYEVASYKIDLYHLFIERGYKLLSDGGKISYITPSNFVSNNYTVTLRKFLLSKAQLASLVFFDESVFEASVHNLVLLAHRNSNICSTTTFYNSRINGGRIELVVTQESKRDSLIDDKCLLIPRRHESALSITDKMDGAAFTIGKLASVNFGMQLRNRKVYKFDVIQDVTDPSVLTPDHRECYAGKDVHRYHIAYSNRQCFFNRDAKCGGCWDEVVHNSKKKILVRQIGAYPEGGIDERGYAVLNAAFMILPKSDKIDSEALLGIINSKLIRYYWQNKYQDNRKTFPKIKGEYLKLLPIPELISSERHSLAVIVSKVIELKKQSLSSDTGPLEAEIDQMVYSFYKLNDEEILTVEGSLE